MVHALSESHRVLKPGGLLFDLRPASIPIKLGLLEAEQFQTLGQVEENFANDRAANAAVETAVARGIFLVEAVSQFECRRQMDSLEDLQSWLAEFKALVDDFATQERLFEQVSHAFQQSGCQHTIAATGQLMLNVLRKVA